MKRVIRVAIIILISTLSSFAQKDKGLYSLCGKTGNCAMTWDEFFKCKKELVPTEKGITINSFLLIVMKAEKRDTISIEYPSRGNAFSKSSLEAIEKIHKDKKMGNKVRIDAVEVLQSGKEARKVPGMIITLTN
jgi:hypothetical protein